MSTDLQLQDVFDSLDDGVLVLDEVFSVVWLNRAGGRLLGCAPTLVLDRPAALCPEIEQFVTQLGLNQPWSEAIGKRSVRRAEIPATDGRPVLIEAVLTLCELNGKRVVSAVMRDISMQKQLERAIFDSRKSQAVGALASGIAHDFNNILTAVISHIDLVLYGGELAERVRQHLVYAQTSARRGAELVSKLQAFSRQGQIQLEHTDLAQIVEHALFVLRRSVDPLIKIEFINSNASPYPVKADSNQLTQVLWNFAINAREAMPKGGKLTFRLSGQVIEETDVMSQRRAGEFIRLEVGDTGHGMAPETVRRVFEPYFSTKDSSCGPGLGLSIAAAVVSEHGGWIEVSSQVGVGTLFSIFLPRCVEATKVHSESGPLISEPSVVEGRERILVVDDEEMVRLVTKAVLAYRGYQISEAVDGEEAIRIYSEASPRFDLVLIDLHMPRLNGYDALARIREIDRNAKAILLSGGTQDPSGFGSGLDGVVFLQKPFDNSELARSVRELLDRHCV
jgi:two-component system, cell cycle sensor histidine kinase and response regulator CckA